MGTRAADCPCPNDAPQLERQIMQLPNMDCGCGGNSQLNGLGYIDTLISAGASLFGKGGGGGAGAAAAPSNQVTTTTNVNTQVSPQISPNFIQQQQPTNSAVNASATMGTPVTGAIPGIDDQAYPGVYTSGGGMTDQEKLIIGGGVAALIVGLLFSMRKRK